MTESSPETLIEQGYKARREQRTAEARERFAEAVDLCRGGNDQALLARALTGLGQIERDLGKLDAALKCYEQAVVLFRGLDRPLVLAHTVRHLADILRNQARLDLAAQHYAEALAIYRAHAETNPLDLANTLRGYALAEEAGNADLAREHWQEAKVLYSQVGVDTGVVEADKRIAHLAG
jgi:tetratricopeptide (TPR) repeat protein